MVTLLGLLEHAEFLSRRSYREKVEQVTWSMLFLDGNFDTLEHLGLELISDLERLVDDLDFLFPVLVLLKLVRVI